MSGDNISDCVISKSNSSDVSFHPRMTVPLVTFTASSVGNLIAIIVIRRNQGRTDQKSVFYTLVMTLALLDLISTWATSPITFTAYTTKQTVTAVIFIASSTCIISDVVVLQSQVCDLGGEALCHYSGITMIYFGIVTMAVVLTMSVERLIAIRFAFFYHTKVNAKKTKSMIMLVLVMFLLFAMLPLVGFGEINQQPPGTWCFLNWRALSPQHQAFNLILAVIGTTMLGGTIFCNIYVIVRVIKKRRKMKLCNAALQVMSKRKLRKIAMDEVQMMILLLVMTCVFTLCYLPLLLRVFMSQITTIYAIEDTTTSWNLFAVRMASINPVLDPWVYILCRRSTLVGFFRLVKMFFTCKCSKEEISSLFASAREHKRTVVTKSFRSTWTSQRQSLVPRDQVDDRKKVALKYGRLWKDAASKANWSTDKKEQSVL